MMGKRIVSALSLTDSLLELPGGISPSKLADDIFNDPLSWQTDGQVDDESTTATVTTTEKRRESLKDVVFGVEKDRSLKREASVFLAPGKQVKPLIGHTKLRPIKLSLNGDNLHQWDTTSSSAKSSRTPKEQLSTDIKRMTRMWTGGSLFRAFPSPAPKHSPLDAPVSATTPHTPPKLNRFSFTTYSSPKDSATWNILQLYTPLDESHQDRKSAAVLPPQPRSARPPKLPAIPKNLDIPPPLPSAPLKLKKLTPAPPTPPIPSQWSRSSASPATSVGSGSSAATAKSFAKQGRRPLPCIPPVNAGLTRSNTLPTALQPDPIQVTPTRVMSEVQAKKPRMLASPPTSTMPRPLPLSLK